jgi:hypothetical protein
MSRWITYRWNYCNGAREPTSRVDDPSNPYLSPMYHPFACKTPIWITVGTLEALYDDGIVLATGKKGMEGNKVELWGEEGATRDIFLMDRLAGFERRQRS